MNNFLLMMPNSLKFEVWANSFSNVNKERWLLLLDKIYIF